MSVIETTKTQVTAIPHVVDELCHACRKCLARTVCKSKAIVQLDPDEPPFIDASRCYGCYLYHHLSSRSHRAGQAWNLKQENAMEEKNNPITVTIFGNRQNENCWSGG